MEVNMIILMEKINKLIEILKDDIHGCDLKWTIFVAAAHSYKYDSLLKPFPSAYVDNKSLNINQLRKDIDAVPTFNTLFDKLKTIYENGHFVDKTINEDTIELVYWCLITNREPSLKHIERSDVSISQI